MKSTAANAWLKTMKIEDFGKRCTEYINPTFPSIESIASTDTRLGPENIVQFRRRCAEHKMYDFRFSFFDLKLMQSFRVKRACNKMREEVSINFLIY